MQHIKQECKIYYDKQRGVFIITPKQVGDPEVIIRPTRHKGRVLTYFFDRTFEFYLCLDEFIFPTHDWFQKASSFYEKAKKTRHHISRKATGHQKHCFGAEHGITY